MQATLAALIATTLLGLLLFTDTVAPRPEGLERDPDDWRVYRAYVNKGIAAREAGKHSEALSALMYAHLNAPKASRTWLIATINLAMCCEVLGHEDAADKYYRDAGKFCPLANNMRDAGDWRALRRKIEEDSDGL